jgi:hypothetical protein
MDPIGRVVMAGLAVFVAWTVVRAIREGSLYSENMEFTIDGNPVMYSLGLIVHAGIVAFCAAMALGYTLPEIGQLCAPLMRLLLTGI